MTRKFTKEALYEVTNDLLIQHGYAGLHFGLIAERLEITRGALYKYFKNKDELIIDFMIYEMDKFLQDLKVIRQYKHFNQQLEYLLDIIFKYSRIHQNLSIVYQIPTTKHVNEKVKQLEIRHHDMYAYLNAFIELGREEKRIHTEFPDHLILGFIFQTVNIPNQTNLPEKQWKTLIMNFLSQGMQADL